MENLRCLIVEDEADWQERFQRACQQRGLKDDQIKVVPDKARAFVELDAWQPDIIVLDLGIPSRTDQGDVKLVHGRDVLKRVRELNRSGASRAVVLIVSGAIDDYSRQEYEEDQDLVVRAVHKKDVGDAVPELLKRAQKKALGVYRDLQNHWPEMLPRFEKLMKESTSPGDVLTEAYILANAMLQKLGDGLMGGSYPIPAADDNMFARIEVLRGNKSRLDHRSPYSGKESAKIYVDEIIYEHFQLIRNYCNCRRHIAGRATTLQHDSLLDVTRIEEKAISDALENMDRAPLILRPAIQDLLAWYLPWHKRQRKVTS
jgi:CheY-like chemotaxis protein